MRRTNLGFLALGLALVVSGCTTKQISDDPGSSGPSSVVTVDQSVGSGDAILPPFEPGGPERRLATLKSPTGNVMQFHENELAVAAKDRSAVEDLVQRYDGKILAEMDLKDIGDDSGLVFYAVSIDASKADVAAMDGVLSKIDSVPNGLAISSDAGLATLAAFINETERGLIVFPNFVMNPDAIADRVATEAPVASGPHSGDYTPNPFAWPYMQQGGALNIGVAEAWRVLEANDKLDTRVRVLVMDAGFKNDDLPPDTALVGATAWDQPNTARCCNGTCDCEWHGTGSARAIAGVVDNARGAAGSGAPVARPLLLQSPREDFFDIIRYIPGVIAGIGGAEIVNISASTTIDQWVCDTSGFFMGPGGVCAFPHAIGAAVRAANILLVASAGNDPARDLDSGDFTMPCEMAGTLCVGGLSWNAPTVSSGSTRASRRAEGAIDIYAPYELWVGSDPENLASNEATIFSGTSASAPFVAGVAALVKAAKPSLHANQIEQILKTTANKGTSVQAYQWVNAYEAVKMAVDGAVPPFITITKPTDGTTEPRVAVPVQFRALVEADGGSPSVSWSSSLDGPLGTGAELTYTGLLSFGTHVISATVENHGLSYTTSVDYTLTNSTPSVSIVSPGSGSSFYAGQLIHLLGTSTDLNEPGGKLTNAQVSWFVDGNLLGTGHEQSIAPNTLGVGSHIVKIVGNDGELDAEQSRSITIMANPTNLPPNIVSITPASGTSLGYADVDLGAAGWAKQVTLTAVATDDAGTLPDSAYTWKTTYTNGSTTLSETLGTGKSITANLKGLCNQATHTVTLSVTDGTHTATKTVIYYVQLLC